MASMNREPLRRERPLIPPVPLKVLLVSLDSYTLFVPLHHRVVPRFWILFGTWCGICIYWGPN